MSAVARPDRTLVTLPRRLWALAVRAPEHERGDHVEITTTVWRVLLTVATSLLLALVLDAHGIVHSGEGMPDGPVRSVTLAVGRTTLAFAEATHLDWPWTTLHSALGYTDQPTVAPLLASGVAGDDGSGSGGGAVLGSVSSPVTHTATSTPSPTATARPTATSLPPTRTVPARQHMPVRAPVQPTPTTVPLSSVEAEMHPHYGRAQKQALARVHLRDREGRTAPLERTAGITPVAGSGRSHPHHGAGPHRLAARQHVPAQVVMTAANDLAAIAHPGTTFRLGIAEVYCWVRNSMLPSGSTTLTFRWIDVANGRVVDQFPVLRSSWAWTGAYDRAVTGAVGAYRCEVTAGASILGSVTFTISLPPLRVPSARHPLRLLVTGDSLTGYLGPVLVQDAAAVGPVMGSVDTHNGTGLTRPDFVDWSLVARQQMARYNPDAVVVMIGGNDFQNMTLPNGQFFQAGTPAWTREYQRRAEVCMRIWAQGGTRRVYWLSMPPARDPAWAHDDNQINIALQRAARAVPGAEYLNILGPVTNHGKYTDYVYNGHGQPILVREPDGVHLNLEGSTIVAQEVLPVLEHDWHLR